MRPSAAVAAAAFATILAACTRDPSRTLSAPAPESALACAERELNARGYDTYQGSVEYGYFYFQRGWDSPTAALLTVTRADGELRVEAVMRNSRNRPEVPDETTLADAKAVLARCAAPEAQARQ